MVNSKTLEPGEEGSLKVCLKDVVISQGWDREIKSWVFLFEKNLTHVYNIS